MSRRPIQIFVCVVATAFLALAWGGPVAQAQNQTLDLRNNIKKLSRYLDDGFCDDALTLATQLSRREDGSRSFSVWFGIAQAHYCRLDVAAALEAVDVLQQTITLSADEARVLSAFTADIESRFGQLRLRMPGNKPGQPRLEVAAVGELEEPALRPFADAVIGRIAAGVDVPDEVIYLPLGTYEVEWSQIQITDFTGVTHVVGRSRPSPWRLSQLGDGLSLAVGAFGLSGFKGDALTIDQLSGGEQIIVTEDRLSFTRTPVFELATTHSFPMGTLGRAQLRFDGRVRPKAAWLGGVKIVGDDTELVPLYLGAGVTAQIQRIEQGFTIQVGVGPRLHYLAYYEFIAFIEDVQTEDGSAYRIPVNTPVWGGGVELLGSVGRSFKVRDRGVQVGLVATLGAAALKPPSVSGEIGISDDDFDGTVTYTLLEEVSLGTTSGLSVYVRIPLF